MEFTKDRLRACAREKVKSLEFSITQTAFADSRAELEEELELARIALASPEAEPVYQVFSFKRWRDVSEEVFEAEKKDGCQVRVLYTAPPAPVSVPDEVSWEDVPEEITEDDMALASAWAHGFNQCRAAMLQGAENAESPSSNYPVVPDGWVMVPVEPTYQMCEAMGLPWESPRFPDRYKAMLAAAQQQEV
ncbi:hypothetical protein [Enterobacter sp.]|uniref:hypothetical protein n=1 Tax=Enterobacter sp. TaxID=42895 RepID=UPI0029094A27|nr:hypothetical protein [Enterobacter sp.]MDU7342612.1 hypothetical protein [Enterobacter sp.]